MTHLYQLHIPVSRTVTVLLLLISTGLLAAEEVPGAGSEVDAALEPLLVELTQASLRNTAAVLDRLEAAGGRTMLPLFQTMLNGDLYFDEETLQIVGIREDSVDVELGTDMLTGANLGEVDVRELEKIRVNNRLRGHLRDAIARIQLTQGDRRERRAAAVSMLDDIDADSAALLASALESEGEPPVREIILVGLAMQELQSSDDRQVRLDAIDVLGGRLENPVRNLLTSFAPGGFMEEPDNEVSRAAEAALESIEGRISFYRFVEQLFFGLSLGSVLLLAAIGLAVTFGVMGVINMAHGEMLMLGAYTTYVVQQLMPNFIDYSLWVAIPAAFIVAAGVGVLIQRYVIRFLNGRPLETLLATFGISLILQETVRTIFSPLNRRVLSPEWMSSSLQVNPVLSLTYNRLYILIFALIVFAILLLILKKSSLGLQVRAVAQNREMARAMGIRTERVDALTFGLGSGIAGIAGVALSQLTNVGPNLGQSYIVDSFMVVVFGGVGNLLGTLVGAFTLGTANKFMEPVTGTVLANILILLFIILFIQKRPKGLFPQRGRAAE